MNMKVKKITEEIFSVISRWPGVECICLNETARVDFLDSYFALIFDVYYEGEMPGIDERTSVFPNASMFETSRILKTAICSVSSKTMCFDLRKDNSSSLSMPTIK